MAVVRFYSREAVRGRALQRAAQLYPKLSIISEMCYNVELTGQLKKKIIISLDVFICSDNI